MSTTVAEIERNKKQQGFTNIKTYAIYAVQDSSAQENLLKSISLHGMPWFPLKGNNRIVVYNISKRESLQIAINNEILEMKWSDNLANRDIDRSLLAMHDKTLGETVRRKYGESYVSDWMEGRISKLGDDSAFLRYKHILRARIYGGYMDVFRSLPEDSRLKRLKVLIKHWISKNRVPVPSSGTTMD